MSARASASSGVSCTSTRQSSPPVHTLWTSENSYGRAAMNRPTARTAMATHATRATKSHRPRSVVSAVGLAS